MNPPPQVKATDVFTILVVDDNRDFVEFIELLLTHHGFSVLSASNGPDGIEMVRAQAVDLVVLDVMMPQMDGLTACRDIKHIRPSLPVILLTAKDDLATRAAAMALGVSEFLAKPVNIDDFMNRIRTQCHAARWERNLDATLAAHPAGRTEPA
jgi:DNA-binding response OmpR family regulator